MLSHNQSRLHKVKGVSDTHSSRMKLPIEIPPHDIPPIRLFDMLYWLSRRSRRAPEGICRAPYGVVPSILTDSCRFLISSPLLSGSAGAPILESVRSCEFDCRICDVSADCCVRGELDDCRLVPISIAGDAVGIALMLICGKGVAVGNRGKSSSSSSSSCGNNKSSEVKSSTLACPSAAFLCQWKNGSFSRARLSVLLLWLGNGRPVADFGVLTLSTLGERWPGLAARGGGVLVKVEVASLTVARREMPPVLVGRMWICTSQSAT